MKRQAESDKKVAQEESKSSQSEIGKLKKEVQSLTQTQQKLETKNKVRVYRIALSQAKITTVCIHAIVHDLFQELQEAQNELKRSASTAQQAKLKVSVIGIEFSCD